MSKRPKRGGGKPKKGYLKPAEPAPEKKFNWKLLIILTLNTAVIFGLYRFLINTPASLYVLYGYLIAVSGLIIAYVIYNRGFSRNGLTLDMLPDTMSFEEKRDYIEDAARRKQKSKWMLTLIIPFLFTFAFEIFELFLLDYFKELLT